MWEGLSGGKVDGTERLMPWEKEADALKGSTQLLYLGALRTVELRVPDDSIEPHLSCQGEEGRWLWASIMHQPSTHPPRNLNFFGAAKE